MQTRIKIIRRGHLRADNQNHMEAKMGFTGADDVVKTAIQAMTKMGKEYSSPYKWTWGNITPWYAPESIYTAAIAQTLAKPANRGIYLEYGIKQMTAEAVIQPKAGRLQKYVRKSRCDILVADGKTDMPRICLEVKRRPNIFSDVNRCMKVVSYKGKSNLRDAAVIFMDSAVKKETLKKRYDKRAKELEKLSGKWPGKLNLAALSKKGGIVKLFDAYKINEHEYGYWYVGAVKIRWSGK